MSGKIHERFIWANEIIQFKPADHVLEIGCGTGIFLDLIIPQISRGSIIAIDRSEKMIARVKKKNPDSPEKGKLDIRVCELAEFKSKISFTKIIAFNVGVFYFSDAVLELERIKNLLAKKGEVFILYQPPGETGDDVLKVIKAKLLKHHFKNISTQKLRSKPSSVVCLRATIN